MNPLQRFLLLIVFAIGVVLTVMTDTVQDAQLVCMESSDIVQDSDCNHQDRKPITLTGYGDGDGEHLPLPSTPVALPSSRDGGPDAAPAHLPSGIVPDVITPPPRLA